MRSAAIDGNRDAKSSSTVASSHRWSTSWSSIVRVIALLTTSRGFSSSTKRSPWRSSSSAPCPRSASDRRGRGIDGRASAVGWNWKNSKSATTAPARIAIATPSPVATRGLVVIQNSCPAPPVANSTLRAATSIDTPSAFSAVTPTTCEPSGDNTRSVANACSWMAAAVAFTACTSARSTSRPVAAPPAWRMRGTLCPPSRASWNSPASSMSKTAPSAISS